MDCRRPGLPGLRACGNVVARLPQTVWRELLPLIHRAKPNAAGWQLALVSGWTISSATVVASTEGDVRLLRAYFETADFRRLHLPYLRSVINERPRARTYYRGGQGTADELALGYSWTPHLDEASHYSHERIVRSGEPVIIRRHVHADEIVLQLRGAVAGETVVLSHRHDGVVEISPMQRERLARRWQRRCTAAQGWAADVLSVPEATLLKGWQS